MPVAGPDRRFMALIGYLARELLGANGISLDYSPIRHMANIESVYTYQGTGDIHTLIPGQDITGMRSGEYCHIALALSSSDIYDTSDHGSAT